MRLNGEMKTMKNQNEKARCVFYFLLWHLFFSSSIECGRREITKLLFDTLINIIKFLRTGKNSHTHIYFFFRQEKITF